MADLVIVSANVLKAANPEVRNGLTAAAAIVAGEPVMQQTDLQVAPADATDDALDEVFGIALNDAAVGQPVSVQVGGVITLGVGTQGVAHFLSENVGKISDTEPTVTGSRVAYLGIGNGTGIALQIHNSAIDIP